MSDTLIGFHGPRLTDHSRHHEVGIELGGYTLQFNDEQPLEFSGRRYVFANGLGGTAESLKIPQCTAAHKLHDARAVGVMHNRLFGAIDQYATEIAAVVAEENPEDETSRADMIHLVGISMGAAAVLRAAPKCRNIASITAEVPAGISDTSIFQELWLGAPARLRESRRLLRERPGFILSAAIHCMASTARRPLGFCGEVIELVTQNAHQDIQAIKEMDDPPHIRIAVSGQDGMFSRQGLLRAAQRLDVEVVYAPESGHVRGVLTDPDYTKNIIRLDDQLVGI